MIIDLMTLDNVQLLLMDTSRVLTIEPTYFDTAFTGSNMQPLHLYPEQFILSTVIYIVNTENI